MSGYRQPTGADIVVLQPSDPANSPPAPSGGATGPGLVMTGTPADPVINNLTSYIWIEPTDANPGANGITVKRPSHTATGWGNKNLPYGQGQPFELLSDSPNDATVSTDPANPVLFRIDSFGGVGICHGAHIATGLREQSDAAVPTQSIWVDPSVDCVGLILDNPTPTEVVATPTASFLLVRDVRPATAYSLFEVKADGTVVSNKAILANPRTSTDVPLTVKAAPTGAAQANVAEFYDFSAKKRLTVTPQDGSLRGVADDGTTASFSVTPLDLGNAGYRAIFAAINVNTYGVAVTSPAGYTKDHYQAVPSGGIKWRINKAGYEVGKMAAAPALADLADGEYAFWLDNAGNALKISARIGGVLKTGTVAVA